MGARRRDVVELELRRQRNANAGDRPRRGDRFLRIRRKRRYDVASIFDRGKRDFLRVRRTGERGSNRRRKRRGYDACVRRLRPFDESRLRDRAFSRVRIRRVGTPNFRFGRRRLLRRLRLRRAGAAGASSRRKRNGDNGLRLRRAGAAESRRGVERRLHGLRLRRVESFDVEGDLYRRRRRNFFVCVYLRRARPRSNVDDARRRLDLRLRRDRADYGVDV